MKLLNSLYDENIPFVAEVTGAAVAEKPRHLKKSSRPKFYTVSQNIHYNIVHNFARCWPIFKIFSLAHLQVNMQQNRR